MMVKFGADDIFRSEGGTITDEDIDAILERGVQKTEELQSKIQTDMSHNLQSFR